MINRDGGLVVTGYLTTTDPNDTYPTHLDNLGKGGIHTTATLMSRDGISAERRSEGMLCFVSDQLSIYQLIGGITNDKWVLIYNVLDGNINFNITCPTDYILVGDQDNKLITSPVLIDTRLDLVEMRKADVIIGHPNHKFPNAQILKNSVDGFLFNNSGTVSTYPRIPFDKLPPLNSTTIQIGPFEYGIKEMLQGTGGNGDVEASYDVWINIISFLTTFKTTSWVLNRGGFLPDAISFPFAQFINALPENRILTHTTDGTIGTLKLTDKHFLKGDANNDYQEVRYIILDDFQDVPYKSLLIGDINNRLEIKQSLYLDNLPDLGIATNPIYLGKGRIWRGTLAGRPEESDDLSSLEIDIAFIKNITIPAIEADITALQAQVGAIEVTLYTPVTGLVSVVSGLVAAVAIIQGQIISINLTLGSHGGRLDTIEADIVTIQAAIVAINTRIDNLRLNNILADADVSFYNFKLINLADPVNPTDGVNLQTLNSFIANLPTSITLQGDVTGTGTVGQPLTTTLELTLDEIKVAENTVNLNNQRITNLKDTISDTSDAISYELLEALIEQRAEEIWQV